MHACMQETGSSTGYSCSRPDFYSSNMFEYKCLWLNVTSVWTLDYARINLTFMQQAVVSRVQGDGGEMLTTMHNNEVRTLHSSCPIVKPE